MAKRVGCTRRDYLNRKCTHRQYYSQFVNTNTKNQLLRYIPKKEIVASKDPHFNDIKIRRWDAIPAIAGTNDKMKKKGDYLTLAGKVCVYKEAAKQIKERK